MSAEQGGGVLPELLPRGCCFQSLALPLQDKLARSCGPPSLPLSLLFPRHVGSSVQTAAVVRVSSRSPPGGHESQRVCSPMFTVSWKFSRIKRVFSLLRPGSSFATHFLATTMGVNHSEERPLTKTHAFGGERQPQSKHMVQG